MAIGFTLVVSLFTGLLFGLAPALHSSRPNLSESLKDGGRGSTDGSARHLFRKALIVSEFALTLILLVGAGLMVKSFIKLQEVKPGFEIDNRLSMRIALPASKYPDFVRQTSFFQEITSRLSSRPGIESVGAISALPLSGFTNDRSFRIEGRPDIPGQPTPDEEIRFVSPAYFSTMGIPVLKGIAFTDRDNADATRVVVINQALKAKYWPDEDAIGKRITYNGKDSTQIWWEIVGIVGNIKHEGLDTRDQPEVYLPYLQPLFSTATSRLTALFFVMETKSDATGSVGATRAEIAALDKDQPIFDVKTMEERLNESVAQRRFNMLLIAVFASVAMILAAVGIYGIISYSVAERTNEIGIRVALGAQASDVFRLIIGQGLLLSLIGVGLGVIGAIGITRLMTTLLFNVKPSDPLTFISISGLLIAVALIACFIPARRATKVDPMVALRYE
jgi:putative ABC transport system permease protein